MPVRLLDHAMRQLTPFKLALILGCSTEALLAGLTAAFGRFGPCGPANELTGIVMLLHLPGIALASPIVDACTTGHQVQVIPEILGTVIVLATGSMMFTGLSYIFVRWSRRSRH